jgi:hypothetical protein
VRKTICLDKDFTVVVNGQLCTPVVLSPGKEHQELFKALRRERFLASARIQILIGWLSSPCPLTIPNCVIPAPNMEYNFIN